MSQNRFRPYDRPDDETSPTAPTRRIDQAELRKDDQSWQGMVNNDWRSDRRRVSTSRTSPIDTFNTQGVASWLSKGGYRYVVIATVVVIVLIIFILYSNRPGQTDDPNGNNTGLNLPNQPTAEIIVGPSPTPEGLIPTDNTQIPSEGPIFAVTGTGSDGLFLRDQPGGNIVKTMPEGTQLTKLSEQDINGILWYQVREVETQIEGWCSAQFLVPAQ
ncbi:SH3 domain-containing protein [Herpetosiphon sp.]|uniref:SH3b domain-containing protein n=1 Tax=Herpetosiphon aurantiacus (strain ATCC 23779 / DSM 785 / 114-95) TaxID=316274 RepID=A9AXD0_HERA2|nr:SH3 domain-containing protein [Herpetosiphon sp.]ABX06850.1 conserved hypothetical protein [Herpetosiphon aurantiacus DSM 785]